MAKTEHLELRYITSAQCYIIEVSPNRRDRIWASLLKRLEELGANTDTRVEHRTIEEGFKVSRVVMLDALSLDGWELIAGDVENLALAPALFRREIPGLNPQQATAND
jgi:hypothetical protein